MCMKQTLSQATSSHYSCVENLYQHYWFLIFNSISLQTIPKEEAEDILVEVFLAALESPVLSTLNEQQQLAWLRRTANNKRVDYYRRKNRRQAVPLEAVGHGQYEDETRSPERMALYREELASLQEGMASLSSQQQEVLLLRFAEGLRCKDIATRLSKTEGAIRTLLSRTLNHLRGIYKQKGEETNHE